MEALDAVRIKSVPGESGGFDFYVNMDNVYLINELRRNRTEDPRVIEYWFKYGLALVAASMLKTPDFRNREKKDIDKETIEDLSAGLARVMCQSLGVFTEGQRLPHGR